MKPWRWIILGAILLPFGRAQTQDYRVTANSELVLLDVGVKDRKGGYIDNLAKANFKVLEDGKPQIISHFASDDVPVTAGLVFDNSGSMRPKRPEVISAGLAFIKGSNPQDEIFITHFNDRVRLSLPPGLPFSGDMETLRAAMWSDPAEGKTALYDAIITSLNHLQNGKREKKALVLVSDGGDNASTHQFQDVMPAVRESRATIYVVGIFDENDPDINPGLLKRLALVTGGEVFFPKEVPEVVDICKGIAKDIRHRYTIGYVPVRTNKKGALRSIKVMIVGTPRHDFVVHARTSYMLPERRGETQ